MLQVEENEQSEMEKMFDGIQRDVTMKRYGYDPSSGIHFRKLETLNLKEGSKQLNTQRT